MRNPTKLLNQAKQVAQLLADHNRFDKAHRELTALRDGSTRTPLTLELLEVSPSQLDKALDRAETEVHSCIMMLDEHLDRPLHGDNA